jgi:hypothetical protein
MENIENTKIKSIINQELNTSTTNANDFLLFTPSLPVQEKSYALQALERIFGRKKISNQNEIQHKSHTWKSTP